MSLFVSFKIRLRFTYLFSCTPFASNIFFFFCFFFFFHLPCINLYLFQHYTASLHSIFRKFIYFRLIFYYLPNNTIFIIHNPFVLYALFLSFLFCLILPFNEYVRRPHVRSVFLILSPFVQPLSLSKL